MDTLSKSSAPDVPSVEISSSETLEPKALEPKTLESKALSPELITFGCRLNAAESASMQSLGAGLGDTIIVNSCSVTQEAERQVRQGVRQARKRRPEARLLVTGCAARIDPNRWLAMPEVDGLIDNEHKLNPAVFSQLKDKHPSKKHIFSSNGAGDLTAPAGLAQGHVRAFLRAQTGCDHSCTFCIIPQGRGQSRSIPPEILIAQSRDLVTKGAKEITLTGVDLTSWGHDFESDVHDVKAAPTPRAFKLGALAKQILKAVPNLELLRLGSIDPAEIDDDLWELIASEPRLAPHLHLSLQAGHDLTLKRMKRRHTVAQAIDVCMKALELRPGLALGADVIAGFPTETEDMFTATLETVRRCGFVYLHVFPYSPRQGTPAARMPQINSAIRRTRAAKLRHIGHTALRKKLHNHVGSEMRVCIETPTKGRTNCFARVRIKDGKVGETPLVRITGFEGEELIADA